MSPITPPPRAMKVVLRSSLRGWDPAAVRGSANSNCHSIQNSERTLLCCRWVQSASSCYLCCPIHAGVLLPRSLPCMPLHTALTAPGVLAHVRLRRPPGPRQPSAPALQRLVPHLLQDLQVLVLLAIGQGDHLGLHPAVARHRLDAPAGPWQARGRRGSGHSRPAPLTACPRM